VDNLHGQLGRNGIRVGDIELEDFKEDTEHLLTSMAMIAFYDVNIQYNLEELEKKILNLSKI
jgi:adenylosuccinate synthase